MTICSHMQRALIALLLFFAAAPLVAEDVKSTKDVTRAVRLQPLQDLYEDLLGSISDTELHNDVEVMFAPFFRNKMSENYANELLAFMAQLEADEAIDANLRDDIQDLTNEVLAALRQENKTWWGNLSTTGKAGVIGGGAVGAAALIALLVYIRNLRRQASPKDVFEEERVVDNLPDGPLGPLLPVPGRVKKRGAPWDVTMVNEGTSTTVSGDEDGSEALVGIDAEEEAHAALARAALGERGFNFTSWLPNRSVDRAKSDRAAARRKAFLARRRERARQLGAREAEVTVSRSGNNTVQQKLVAAEARREELLAAQRERLAAQAARREAARASVEGRYKRGLAIYNRLVAERAAEAAAVEEAAARAQTDKALSLAQAREEMNTLMLARKAEAQQSGGAMSWLSSMASGFYDRAAELVTTVPDGDELRISLADLKNWVGAERAAAVDERLGQFGSVVRISEKELTELLDDTNPGALAAIATRNADYQAGIKAVQALQAAARMKPVRNSFRAFRESAPIVQNKWRSFSAHRKMLEKKVAIDSAEQELRDAINGVDTNWRTELKRRMTGKTGDEYKVLRRLWARLAWHDSYELRGRLADVRSKKKRIADLAPREGRTRLTTQLSGEEQAELDALRRRVLASDEAIDAAEKTLFAAVDKGRFGTAKKQLTKIVAALDAPGFVDWTERQKGQLEEALTAYAGQRQAKLEAEVAALRALHDEQARLEASEHQIRLLSADLSGVLQAAVGFNPSNLMTRVKAGFGSEAAQKERDEKRSKLIKAYREKVTILTNRYNELARRRPEGGSTKWQHKLDDLGRDIYETGVAYFDLKPKEGAEDKDRKQKWLQFWGKVDREAQVRARRRSEALDKAGSLAVSGFIVDGALDWWGTATARSLAGDLATKEAERDAVAEKVAAIRNRLHSATNIKSGELSGILKSLREGTDSTGPRDYRGAVSGAISKSTKWYLKWKLSEKMDQCQRESQ